MKYLLPMILWIPIFSDQSIPAIPATTAGSGNTVIEEVDDMVTVEDAGEEIKTIIVDESLDVPISVSGEDPSGSVEGEGNFK